MTKRKIDEKGRLTKVSRTFPYPSSQVYKPTEYNNKKSKDLRHISCVNVKEIAFANFDGV